MAKEIFIVTTGSKAYSFHDQSTGITICKGEEVELSRRQYLSIKIQRALASGHLQIVHDKSHVEKYSEKDIEKLGKRLEAQIKKGMTIEKMAKAYSLEEMKLIAENIYELEPEETDTVESLIQEILKGYEENK